jgi:phosphoribosylformylglycinamidine cyclo-ligase
VRKAGLGSAIHAAAHVSGGGLPGNLPRSIADGLAASVDRRLVRELAGSSAALFDIIERYGRVSQLEMWRVFNLGVGFVLLVDQTAAQAVAELIATSGNRVQQIGKIVVAPGAERLVWSD